MGHQDAHWFDDNRDSSELIELGVDRAVDQLVRLGPVDQLVRLGPVGAKSLRRRSDFRRGEFRLIRGTFVRAAGRERDTEDRGDQQEGDP